MLGIAFYWRPNILTSIQRHSTYRTQHPSLETVLFDLTLASARVMDVEVQWLHR